MSSSENVHKQSAAINVLLKRWHYAAARKGKVIVCCIVQNQIPCTYPRFLIHVQYFCYLDERPVWRHVRYPVIRFAITERVYNDVPRHSFIQTHAIFCSAPHIDRTKKNRPIFRLHNTENRQISHHTEIAQRSVPFGNVLKLILYDTVDTHSLKNYGRRRLRFATVALRWRHWLAQNDLSSKCSHI